MKYPKLNSLVPAGESFDESAINEGVWLTVSHINAVEKQLSQNETAIATANSNAQTLTEENTRLKNEAVSAKAASDAKDQMIAQLQAKVDELGIKPSGTGTTLQTTKDPELDQGKKPSYLDDSKEINQWADSKMKRKKKAA